MVSWKDINEEDKKFIIGMLIFTVILAVVSIVLLIHRLWYPAMISFLGTFVTLMICIGAIVKWM